METQPTQPGMMQLFMSLGLATDNPLNTLNSGGSSSDGANTPAFGSILAGFKPGSTESSPSLLAKSAEDGGEMLTGDFQSPLSLPSDLEAMTAESLPLAGEGLPLINSELPLASSVKPDGLRAAEAIKSREGQGGSHTITEDGLAEQGLESDDSTAVMANQGFHAQSLVSSLLPVQMTQSVSPQARVVTVSSGMNSNLTSRTTTASLSNPTSTGLSSLDASSASELTDDLAAGLNLNDRFLGADGSTKPVKPMSGQEFNSANPVNTANNPIPQPLVDPALLAISEGEDPVTESLQDLKNLADVEKSESENKLTSSERRQDDQTLKLTKGQQAWGDALSERIAMNAAKDIKQVTIHLDPPELGSLELKLQIKDDQQTQVQVQVQSPQVKEALESSAQRLKDMLANQGLELSEFDVQTGSEQGKGQDGSSAEGTVHSEQQDSDALLAEGEEMSLDIQLPKNNNLLDTFV